MSFDRKQIAEIIRRELEKIQEWKLKKEFNSNPLTREKLQEIIKEELMKKELKNVLNRK